MARLVKTGHEGLQGNEGPEGKEGKIGPEGEVGPEGPEGPQPESYVHTQETPAAEWTINHNMKRFPSVVVQDSAKSEIEGDIEYLNNEQLKLKFSAAFSGAAYLN